MTHDIGWVLRLRAWLWGLGAGRFVGTSMWHARVVGAGKGAKAAKVARVQRGDEVAGMLIAVIGGGLFSRAGAAAGLHIAVIARGLSTRAVGQGTGLDPAQETLPAGGVVAYNLAVHWLPLVEPGRLARRGLVVWDDRL